MDSLVTLAIITPLFFELGFRVCFLALCGIGIIHWIRNRKTLRLERFEKVLLFCTILFVSSGLLSYLANDHFRLSRSTAMEVYPIFLGLVPLILLFKKNQPGTKHLVFSFSLLTLISSGAALWQLFFNGPLRIRVLLSHNNNEFVTPLLIGTFFCLASFVMKKELRFLAFFSAVAGSAAILFIENRMAWIVFAFLTILTIAKLVKPYTKKAGFFVLFILLLIGSYQFTNIKARIIGTQKNLSLFSTNKDTSIGRRFELTKMGLYYFKQSPFFGIGPRRLGDKNFTKELQQKNKIAPQAFGHGHFHNQYVESLATRGAFGFLCLLSIFALPLVRFIKKEKDSLFFSFCGLAVIVTYGGISFSNSPLEFKFLIMFFTLCLSLFLSRLSSGPKHG